MNPDCPPNCGALSIALRWEFRRHHFSERERLVLDWMLDCSLVCGRGQMVAPTLDAIGQLAHISRGNTHTILEDLKAMRVITCDESSGVKRYAINSHSCEWKCRERLSKPALKIALAEIRAANGLDTEFFTRANTPSLPPPSAKPPPLDAFFCAAEVSESGTATTSET